MSDREMFKCPACEHGYFRVVAVKREGKPDYETEFIACSRCGVMQWRPGSEPKNQTPPPLFATWGTGPKVDE
jgi:transcription elongation factor Elf1